MIAHRTRPMLALAALVGLVGGCAIQADSGPRDVPEEHSARAAIEPPAEGAEATGEGRIYLLAPDGSGQPLRTVLRPSKDLVQALALGPNPGEGSQGLATALPASLEVNSVRFDGGVVIVDLTEDINDLSGENLRLAVAQIVFTASEIQGVDSVLIRVDGESQSWPNGEGTPISRPLTVYDFVGYAESSQPSYPVAPRNPTSDATAPTTTTVAASTTVATTVTTVAPTTG